MGDPTVKPTYTVPPTTKPTYQPCIGSGTPPLNNLVANLVGTQIASWDTVNNDYFGPADGSVSEINPAAGVTVETPGGLHFMATDPYGGLTDVLGLTGAGYIEGETPLFYAFKAGKRADAAAM